MECENKNVLLFQMYANLRCLQYNQAVEMQVGQQVMGRSRSLGSESWQLAHLNKIKVILDTTDSAPTMVVCREFKDLRDEWSEQKGVRVSGEFLKNKHFDTQKFYYEFELLSCRSAKFVFRLQQGTYIKTTSGCDFEISQSGCYLVSDKQLTDLTAYIGPVEYLSGCVTSEGLQLRWLRPRWGASLVTHFEVWRCLNQNPILLQKTAELTYCDVDSHDHLNVQYWVNAIGLHRSVGNSSKPCVHPTPAREFKHNLNLLRDMRDLPFAVLATALETMQPDDGVIMSSPFDANLSTFVVKQGGSIFVDAVAARARARNVKVLIEIHACQIDGLRQRNLLEKWLVWFFENFGFAGMYLVSSCAHNCDEVDTLLLDRGILVVEFFHSDVTTALALAQAYQNSCYIVDFTFYNNLQLAVRSQKFELLVGPDALFEGFVSFNNRSAVVVASMMQFNNSMSESEQLASNVLALLSGGVACVQSTSKLEAVIAALRTVRGERTEVLENRSRLLVLKTGRIIVKCGSTDWRPEISGVHKLLIDTSELLVWDIQES